MIVNKSDDSFNKLFLRDGIFREPRLKIEIYDFRNILAGEYSELTKKESENKAKIFFEFALVDPFVETTDGAIDYHLTNTNPKDEVERNLVRQEAHLRYIISENLFNLIPHEPHNNLSYELGLTSQEDNKIYLKVIDKGGSPVQSLPIESKNIEVLMKFKTTEVVKLEDRLFIVTPKKDSKP